MRTGKADSSHTPFSPSSLPPPPNPLLQKPVLIVGTKRDLLPLGVDLWGGFALSGFQNTKSKSVRKLDIPTTVACAAASLKKTACPAWTLEKSGVTAEQADLKRERLEDKFVDAFEKFVQLIVCRRNFPRLVIAADDALSDAAAACRHEVETKFAIDGSFPTASAFPDASRNDTHAPTAPSSASLQALQFLGSSVDP